MLRPILLLFITFSVQSFSQQNLDKLTVEKIMRDPKWMGTSPSNVQWSQDGQYLYFRWNPDNAPADSLYYISLTNKTPVKAGTQETQNYNATGNFVYNQARTAYTFSKDGDVFYTDIKANKNRRITQTTDAETKIHSLKMLVIFSMRARKPHHTPTTIFQAPFQGLRYPHNTTS